MPSSIDRIFNLFIKITSSERDSQDDRIKKGLLVLLAVLMSFGGLGWGIMCLGYGAYIAMIIPFSYTFASVCNFILFRITKSYQVFRFIQFLSTLLLPYFLHWFLGGFNFSGGVMIWAVLAPFGAMLFYGIRGAKFWLYGYLFLLAFSLAAEYVITFPIPSDQIQHILFPMDFIVVPLITYILIQYFVTQMDNKIEKLNDQNDALVSVNNQINETSEQTEGFSKELENKLVDSMDHVQYTIRLNHSLTDQQQQVNSHIHQMTDSLTLFHQDISAFLNDLQHQSQTIKEIGETFYSFHQSFTQVNQITQEKTNVLDQLIALTDEGASKVNSTQDRILQIAKYTDSMMTIVDLINNVSRKTNLLSMNASIEAAHAGTYGKGFAVVAEEIQNLAQSTSDGAKQISNLLAQMLKQIENTKDEGEKSQHSFAKIQVQVEQVFSGLNDISKKTKDLSSFSTYFRDTFQILESKATSIFDRSSAMKVQMEQNQHSLQEFQKGYTFLLESFNETTVRSDQLQQSINEITIISKNISQHISHLAEFTKESVVDVKMLQMASGTR